ncbi:MAG: hypothetical protein QM817_33865 [Archangium sp.]
MRKALLVSAGVVLLAFVACWLLGGEDAPAGASLPPGDGTTSSPRSRPSFDDEAASGGLGAGGALGADQKRSDVQDGTDAATAAFVADAQEVAAAVKALTDATIRSRLQQNAARAKAEVDRFCELNEKVKKSPLFDEKPGTRDAAIFMASRVDWEGSGSEPPRYGSLHLPDAIREKTRGNFFLTTITDADLQGLDFGWFKQLLQFDVWTFGGDGSGEELRYAAMVSSIPNFVVLQQWVKLRFARALRDGDWNDAVLEVRHLAYLTHTMSIAISDAIAISLFKLELKARELAAQLGVAAVASLPPPPDMSVLDAQRATAVKSGWFVAPGVDKETRDKALGCTALPCTTLVEGMSLHSSLRTWAEPDELQGFLDATKGFTQCDASMTKRLMKMPPATLQDLHWLLEQEDGPLLPTLDGGR